MVLRRPRTIAQTCTSTLLVPTQPLVAIAAAYSPHCAQPAHRHLAPQNRPHETLPLLLHTGPPPWHLALLLAMTSQPCPRSIRSTLSSIHPVCTLNRPPPQSSPKTIWGRDQKGSRAAAALLHTCP